MLAKEQYKKML